MKKLLKNEQGFTIIEVMIVLVIAAVILLIVFLAVPALQRNSRNTQLRSDVTNVLGAINEYASNNNGGLPLEVCVDTATGTLRAVSSGACNTTSSPEIGKIRAGTAVTTVASPGTTMPTANNTINVFLGRKCATSSTVSATATPRAFAAGYLTEGSGGANNGVCQES